MATKRFRVKKKTIDEIIRRSFFQVMIVTVIVRFLNFKLTKDFILGTNESGLYLGINVSFTNDIQIIDKSLIKDFYSNKFLDIPYRVVIEVDTKADIGNSESPVEYFYRKTQKMLDFGIEKVIWVMTSTR